MTGFPPPQPPAGDILVFRLRLQQLASRLEGCAVRLRAVTPDARREPWTPPQGQPALPSARRARRLPGVEKA